MKWFNNQKVKVKMLISFILVIVLMAAMATFAIIEQNTVSGHYEYAIDHPIEAEVQLVYFTSAMREFRRMVSDMTIYAPIDVATVDSIHQEALNTTFNEAIAALDAFESTFSTDTRLTKAEKDSEQKQAADLRAAFTAYKTQVFDPVYTSASAGDSAGAVRAYEAGKDLANSINDQCDALTAAMQSSTDSTIAVARTATSRSVVIVLIVAVVIAVLSIIVALYISGLISKPLITLSAFMHKAGTTGDISLRPEDVAVIDKFAQNKDELGQVIHGTASFVQHIETIAKELEEIAAGDLTNDFTLLSDKDTMGTSLEQMTSNLNRMFAEIQTSTNQVSTGSKQVADGAQSLAQGSTEQAASIQELSSSISEIAVKTKQNAATAEKTAKLSETIRASAEKGSQQMEEMIAAVKDINEASNSIGKIIKTIDDIAFQTNILALNAAVEAARAGQHGKGFAVVAEEVRSLASKSAEAAKDTGNMIQNSIEKAELGSRIAGETSASLSDIVVGINESSQLISEIAEASESQSLGISQINIGIDQVAQVVQQNSATAEESAAASEEMSGQSDILQQLITQFKLKDSNAMYRSLPSAERPAQRRLSMQDSGASSFTSNNDYGKY